METYDTLYQEVSHIYGAIDYIELSNGVFIHDLHDGSGIAENGDIYEEVNAIINADGDCMFLGWRQLN